MAFQDFISKFESLGSASNFIGFFEDFVEKFSEEYIKDKDAKSALIDEVCQYLQSLKGTKNG